MSAQSQTALQRRLTLEVRALRERRRTLRCGFSAKAVSLAGVDEELIAALERMEAAAMQQQPKRAA